MHLQDNESIIKVFHHHPFPFVLRALGIGVASLPFFLVASFFSGVLTTSQMVMVYAGIGLVFGLVFAYVTFLYLADRLVVTNMRLVHAEWKSLFIRQENEVELNDIEDINTEEMGILSYFKIFDYGVFHIETAASSPESAIYFRDATDPEGIKHFIYHLQSKHSKILTENFEINSTTANDRTSSTEKEEVNIS